MKYLIAILSVIFSAGFVMADDPGVRDSLIIETVYVELTDTTVDVRAYVTCDDSVAFYNFPLTWNSINDSSVFPTSVAYQNTIAQWDFHLDSLLFTEVLFRMVGWRDGGPEDPALYTNSYREHCWTIRFSLDSSFGPQVVTIDTTYDYSNGSLLFGLAGGVYSLTPVFTSGAIYYGVTSESDGENQILPEEIVFLQNYPNPLNSSTTIEFSLKNETYIELSIYDLLGRKVAILTSGLKSAGSHKIKFDAGGLSSGVYFYGLRAENLNEFRRMVILK